MKQDITKKINSGIDMTKDLAEKSLSKAQEKINGAVDLAASLGSATKKGACDCRDSVIDYTTTKPVHALVMAMGVGAILGHCIFRKKKSRDEEQE